VDLAAIRGVLSLAILATEQLDRDVDLRAHWQEFLGAYWSSDSDPAGDGQSDKDIHIAEGVICFSTRPRGRYRLLQEEI